MEKPKESNQSEMLEDVNNIQESEDPSLKLKELSVNKMIVSPVCSKNQTVQLELADGKLEPSSEVEKNSSVLLKAKDNSQAEDILIENAFLRSKQRRPCKLCNREYLSDRWFLKHLLQAHCRNHSLATNFFKDACVLEQLLRQKKQKTKSAVLRAKAVDKLEETEDKIFVGRKRKFMHVSSPLLNSRNKSPKVFSCCKDASPSHHIKHTSSRSRSVDARQLQEFEEKLALKQQMDLALSPTLKHSEHAFSTEHTNNGDSATPTICLKRKRGRPRKNPCSELPGANNLSQRKFGRPKVLGVGEETNMEPNVASVSDATEEPAVLKVESVPSVNTAPNTLSNDAPGSSLYGIDGVTEQSTTPVGKKRGRPRKRKNLPDYMRHRQKSAQMIITKYQRIRTYATKTHFRKKIKKARGENCDSTRKYVTRASFRKCMKKVEEGNTGINDIKLKNRCCNGLNKSLLPPINVSENLYKIHKKLTVSLIRIEDLPTEELERLRVKLKRTQTKTFPMVARKIERPLNNESENISMKKEEKAAKEDQNPQLCKGTEDESRQRKAEVLDNNSNCTAGTGCNCKNAVTTNQDEARTLEDDPKTNVILDGLASLKLNSYENVKTSVTDKPKIDEEKLLLQKRLYENGSSSILVLKHWLLNNNLHAEYSRLFGKSNINYSKDTVATREKVESDSGVASDASVESSMSKARKRENEDKTEIPGKTVGFDSGNPEETHHKDSRKETSPLHSNLNENSPSVGSELSKLTTEKPTQKRNITLRTRSIVNFTGQLLLIGPEKDGKPQSPIRFTRNSLKKLKTESYSKCNSNNVAMSSTPTENNVTNSKDDKQGETIPFPKPVQCYLCDKEFKLQEALDEHMYFLHDTLPDGKLAKDFLKPHSNQHEKEESTSVDKVESSSKTLLGTSPKIHAVDAPMDTSTEVDRETDDEEGSYTEWERSHTVLRENKKWRCKLCKDSFESIRNYLRHKYYSHNDESAVHICDNCNEALTSVAMVNIHMCKNVRTWKCKRCNVSFSNGTSFTQHNINYHAERIGPHACNMCKSTFLTNSMLQRHKPAHYKATDNVNNFLHSSSASAHNSLFNVSSNMFNLSVNDVKKEMDVAADALTSHPTICRETSNADQLYIEQVTCFSETNESPADTIYKCKFCDFVCLTKLRMKFHLEKEHNIKVENCQLCGDLYVADVELRHLRNRHIISDYQYAKDASNVNYCAAEDFDNDLVKLLGFKRLLSLFEYQKFDNVPRNESFQCTVCSKEFSSSHNYRIHYLEAHDLMCVLCNVEFEHHFQALEHKTKAHISVNSYLWAIQKIIVSIHNFKKYGNTMEATILKYNEIAMRANGECSVNKEENEVAKKYDPPDDAKLLQLKDFDDITGELESTELVKDKLAELPIADDTSLLCLESEYKVDTNSFLLVENHLNDSENKFLHLFYTLDSTEIMSNNCRSEQQILSNNENFVLLATENALETHQENVKDVPPTICSPPDTFSDDHTVNALIDCPKTVN